jgi:hypothetical protein
MGFGINRERFSRKKDQDWVDWLSDEANPADSGPRVHKPKSAAAAKPPLDTRRQERLRQAGLNRPLASQPPRPHSAASISININLPKFRLPKVRVPWKAVGRWAAFTVIVLGVGVGMRASLELLPGDTPGKRPGNGTAVVETKPSYQPLAPKDKQNLASNDPSISSYDPQRRLYSYNDIFLGARLTVSQQPIPESFKKDQSQIRKAADSIYAKEKIETALGPAYIGFDQKTNIQRTMLVYKDLLVFIQTDKKLDNDALKTYIETLR